MFPEVDLFMHALCTAVLVQSSEMMPVAGNILFQNLRYWPEWLCFLLKTKRVTHPVLLHGTWKDVMNRKCCSKDEDTDTVNPALQLILVLPLSLSVC